MSIVSGIERLSLEKGALKDTSARKRLKELFDGGSFTELDKFMKNSAEPVEVITAYGMIGGMPVYAFSQDVSVLSGAMGRMQAAKIKRVYDLARTTGQPVIGIYDSNGAHLSEGVDALAAYGELILASNNISGVVPQISLIAGPCIGSAAILASIADVVIMVKGAELYLTNGKILGDKSGEVGSSAAAAVSGLAHLTVDTQDEASSLLKNVLSFLPDNNLSVSTMVDYVPAAGDTAALDTSSSAGMILSAVADAGSTLELSPKYGKGLKTFFCRIGGTPVGIVATEYAENNGYIDSDAASKAARFVRMCDAFSVPIVTLVNTDGFASSRETELSGSLKDIALLTHAYAEATTPKISVITGNAFGPAYIALAGRAAHADLVFAWPDAAISTLPPATAVELLCRDRLAAGEKRAELESEYLKTAASAFEAATKGYIDDIILPGETFAKLITALEMLSGKRVSTLDKKHSNMPL